MSWETIGMFVKFRELLRLSKAQVSRRLSLSSPQPKDPSLLICRTVAGPEDALRLERLLELQPGCKALVQLIDNQHQGSDACLTQRPASDSPERLPADADAGSQSQNQSPESLADFLAELDETQERLAWPMSLPAHVLRSIYKSFAYGAGL